MTLHRHCALCRANELSPLSAAGPGGDAPLADFAGEPLLEFEAVPQPPRPPLRRLGARMARDLRANNNVTMIVVLAGLLASGTAATFLLDSAESLRDRGSQATDDATGSFARVSLVDAYARAGPAGLATIHELIAPAPLTEEVDLSELTVIMESGGRRATFAYAFPPAPGTFAMKPVRDEDASLQPTRPILNEGDLVELEFALPGSGLELGPRAVVKQTIVSAGGGKVHATFEVPPSFSAGDLVDFRE